MSWSVGVVASGFRRLDVDGAEEVVEGTEGDGRRFSSEVELGEEGPDAMRVGSLVFELCDELLSCRGELSLVACCCCGIGGG